MRYQERVGARPFHTFESRPLSDRMTLGVNVASGNLLLSSPDLRIAGTGLDLGLTRFYNHLDYPLVGSFGNGGTSSLGDVRLQRFRDGSVAYHAPSGYAVPFLKRADGSFTTPSGENSKLVENGDGTYRMSFNRTGQLSEFRTDGRLAAQVDQNGNRITLAYTPDGNGVPALSSITDTQGRVTTIARDEFTGFIDTVTDPSGRIYQYALDDFLWNLLSYTDPAGKVMSFTWDGSNLAQVTDPKGNVTKLTYDSARRVATVKRVDNPTAGTGPTTTYGYAASTTGCPAGTVGATSSTDPNAKTTRYCYDRMGRVTTTIDARGNARASTYTANSNVQSYTSGAGGVSTGTYDSLDNLTGVTDAAGATTAIAYADTGHPYSATKRTDPTGDSTSFAYSAAGNLCSVSAGPTGPPDCSTSVPDQTRLAYNTNGTITSATDPKGNVTGYGYDTPGNRTSVDNPAPLGDEVLGYDGLSRLISFRDGKSQTTTFEWDKLDRLTKLTYQGGATITYVYDAAGNRTSRVDNTGTTTYTYDRLNRLTQEALPGGRTNAYTYDGVGNLKSLVDAGGTVSYAYDASNNLSSLTEPGGFSTAFAYNANDARTVTTLPSATGVTIVQTYEGDRLTRIRATKGATVLTDFLYCTRLPVAGCDASPQTGTSTDRRQRVKDLVTGDSTVYSYDVLGRLLRAQTVGANPSDYQYGYDAASNRTSQVANGVATTYVYNPANQLTSAGATTYAYDLNGNLSSSSGGLALAYNTKDQTTSVTPPGGSATAFTYTGPGQADRTASGGTAFTGNVLGLGYQVISGVRSSFTRDDHGNLIGQRIGANRYYYLTDGLGSTSRLINQSGTVTNTYRYDPFGRVVATTGTTSNPFKYAGEYQDVSGFSKIGLRYYDPATARWSQQDVLSSPSVDRGNRYAYVAGDPVNRIDPLGLFSIGISVSAKLGVGFSAGISVDTNGSVGLTAGGGVGIGGGASAEYSESNISDSSEINGGGCALACLRTNQRGNTSYGIGPRAEASLEYRRTQRLF